MSERSSESTSFALRLGEDEEEEDEATWVDIFEIEVCTVG